MEMIILSKQQGAYFIALRAFLCHWRKIHFFRTSMSRQGGWDDDDGCEMSHDNSLGAATVVVHYAYVIPLSVPIKIAANFIPPLRLSFMNGARYDLWFL